MDMKREANRICLALGEQPKQIQDQFWDELTREHMPARREGPHSEMRLGCQQRQHWPDGIVRERHGQDHHQHKHRYLGVGGGAHGRPQRQRLRTSYTIPISVAAIAYIPPIKTTASAMARPRPPLP